MAGNPLTDKSGDINSRLEYAYRMALISVELYEVIQTPFDCGFVYVLHNKMQLIHAIYFLDAYSPRKMIVMEIMRKLILITRYACHILMKSTKYTINS